MTDLTLAEDVQELVSYRKNVTGVDHVVFISPRGRASHGARVKVAIDPPDSLNPACTTASVSLDGTVVAGEIEPVLLRQVQQFIERNRAVLTDYWEYKIDTDELRHRLVR